MESVIAELRRLAIQPKNSYTHGPVMTSEEQADSLPNLGAGVQLAKNMMLKDKKNRIFLIVASSATNLKLNILSARLGQGKGGVRMAPTHLIPHCLGVEQGSVTPLALMHPNAAQIVPLLDAKFKHASAVVVHPGVNTASVELLPADLEKFLRAHNFEVNYVDLEAEPKLDKDNPGDLKPLAEQAIPYSNLPDAPNGASQPAKGSTTAAQQPSNVDRKGDGGNGRESSGRGAPVEQRQGSSYESPEDSARNIVDEVLSSLESSGLLQRSNLSEKAHIAALEAVHSYVIMLKNRHYADGRSDARKEIVAYLQGEHQ